ncbi:hypothetical protein ACSYAF_05410 [Edwardsiella tarda]|uniref:hypothetical protein n=1 Tax=Edwardsiella tarda TaxID=636 RepID=UPI003A72F4F2
MSTDGSIIGGSGLVSTNSSAACQAYVVFDEDKMVKLGSLKADNTGESSTLFLSTDGRVAAGYSDTDGGSTQAFI